MTQQLTNHTSRAIDIDKFLLILGIVMIHTNVCVGLTPEQLRNVNPAGRLIMELFIGSCGAVYVPCFFIISGFLYFLNVTDFTLEQYKAKSIRRIHTLLIPYILWNILGLTIQLLKTTVLHYPSYGIFTAEHHLDALRLLEGFWNLQDGYPYAVAFWFIRNLIIFVALAPLAYSLCRNRWIFIAFLLLTCIGGVELYGMQYFVIGGFMALNGRKALDISPRIGVACGLIWIGLSAYRLHFFHPPVSLNLIQSVAAFFAIFSLAKGLFSVSRNQIFRMLISSTFFIYAFHQFFFSLTREYYSGLFGLNTLGGVLAAFLASCATLVGVSFAVWLLMQRVCPKLLEILTGNR